MENRHLYLTALASSVAALLPCLGLAKVIAVILRILALPALVVGIVSAAGAFLLFSVGLVADAWELLKTYD